MIFACQRGPHAHYYYREDVVQHREGSIFVHFALALQRWARAWSWAQLAPCIILLLMRRVASARFWGHRDRMMSGSTTPSIHNQRLIGMHQHYWTQRHRLSQPLSSNMGSFQLVIFDAQCWSPSEPHFRPGTRHPALQSNTYYQALPCCNGPRPTTSGCPSPFIVRASHLQSANSCVYQN